MGFPVASTAAAKIGRSPAARLVRVEAGFGYDVFEPSCQGTTNAKAAGVADRCRFRNSTRQPDRPSRYDVITTFDVIHGAASDTAATARRALRVAAIAPFADRRATQGEVARRRLQPMLLRIGEDPEALFHSDAVLGRNLDVGHRCSPDRRRLRPVNPAGPVENEEHVSHKDLGRAKNARPQD